MGNFMCERERARSLEVKLTSKEVNVTTWPSSLSTSFLAHGESLHLFAPHIRTCAIAHAHNYVLD